MLNLTYLLKELYLISLLWMKEDLKQLNSRMAKWYTLYLAEGRVLR